MREKILEYLKKKFQETRWPYVKAVDLAHHVGQYPREELNQLLEEGLIAPAKGINGMLIKLTKRGQELLTCSSTCL